MSSEPPPWATPNEKGVRQPLRVGGTALLALSFQTLGIIYSDIGTSPLYVLNGIWPSSGSAPSQEDVVGGVSAILWAMTLVPLLKYVVFGLRFGTREGEGGTFALFHGIFPPKAVDYDEDRALTTESGWKTPSSGSSTAIRTFLGRLKWALLAWSLFGTSLTFADGMLTPAVSVTSAVGGIALSIPSLTPNIGPISIGFIAGLFIIQRFGTAKVSAIFSPVTFVWLLVLFITGIYNVVSFPGILRAFDPSRAVMWFARTGQYDLLAGVLLAVTGCEAMFANLGQFNRLSIQLSFAFFAYPALVMAYLGQGAQLITNGDIVIQNVFYATIPGGAGSGMYWFVYVLAILATVSWGFVVCSNPFSLMRIFFKLVASQATITATFSLFQQVINLRSLPPVRMKYTSETIQGQIYIPSINWVLCAGTIIFVLIFPDLSKLTNAYGFAVSTVMIVTTTLIFVQILYVKHRSWFLAFAWLIFFGCIDALFWGAALRKVPHGAWVPLVIGFVLMVFMVFWTWAKGLEDEFDGANRRNLRHFISKVTSEKISSSSTLTSRPLSSRTVDFKEDDITAAKVPESNLPAEDQELVQTVQLFLDVGGQEKVPLIRMSTMAIFHKLSSGKGVPHTFYGFLKQWPALPRVVVFLSVRVMPVAHVDKEERYHINKVRTLPGFYGATYMKGFRDRFNIDVDTIVGLISALEVRANDSAKDAERINEEIRIASKSTTHVVPHYHVVSRRIIVFAAPLINWFRRTLIEEVYRSIAYVFPETVTWLQGPDEIIHVGVTAVI